MEINILSNLIINCLMWMMMSIILVLGSNSILIQWVMLEFSSLLICTIFLNQHKLSSSGGAIKYFISQAPASAIILFSYFLCAKVVFSEMIITFCLLYKLGLPPFHGWVFSLIPELNLFSFGVLMSVNKIIPLIMLSQINVNSMLLIPSLLSLLMMMLFTFYSMNSIYYILTMSSMINFQWFLFCLKNSIWMSLVVVYCFILISVISLLKLNLVFKTKDFAKINTMKFSLLGFSFFSLAGLPPFLGFLIKLTMIKIMILLKMSAIWLLLLLTLLIQFAYINMFYFSYCVIPNKSVSNEMKLYDQSVLGSMMIFSFPNWMDLAMMQI